MRSKAVRRSRRDTGQVLVVFALGLMSMVAGLALILDGGNAYVQQRRAQNAADGLANAGAEVLAQRLGGVSKTDGQVLAELTATASLTEVSMTAYYTNVAGKPIDASGNVTTAALAVQVGSAAGNAVPPNAQGVHVSDSRTFGTTFARVIGLNSFTAGAEAVAITGRLTGGEIFPVIFPVNITDCSGSGTLGVGKDQWAVAQPGDTAHPVGQEFIVPLCKTGQGSFMVLDLDGIKNNCADEITHPTLIQFADFPVDVATDNGNNCAKPLADAVSLVKTGKTVLIPICDDNACNTTGGTNATYHVTGVVSFYVDYMDDSNNDQNSLCAAHTNSDGQSVVPISGNGSSSCLVGWFVRYITAGPVGTGPVGNADAVGIQLIK